jgi:peptide chain release factor subunit 1
MNDVGFIIVDYNQCLFGKLSGNTPTILHAFESDLSKSTGGVNALKYARERMERRSAYFRTISEKATQFFIMNNQPIVSELVLAGSAGIDHYMSTDDMFDPRLLAIVSKIIKLSYGGQIGFDQAIKMNSLP